MNVNPGDWVEILYEEERFTAKVLHAPTTAGEYWEIKRRDDGSIMLLNPANPNLRWIAKTRVVEQE